MIPVYNRAHLIGPTLESVLAQTYTDFEAVVVDDASTDGTLEVALSYCSDPRLRVVSNEWNLGLTGNWNHCIQVASGSLVQIMQSDDLMDKNYLHLVDQVFKANPSVGFVAASCRYIDLGGKVTHPGIARPRRLYRAGDEAVLAIMTVDAPHVSSIVVRRECYEKVGLLDPRIWHGPDLEMDARLAAHFDFFHLGSVHTSFRRHGANRGVLEYLRQDFLETHALKFRLAWGYMSQTAREAQGIVDLERFLASDSAGVAVNGAVAILAYGRRDLARFYLKRALELDRGIWRKPRFRKGLLLFALGGLGVAIMRKRMQVGGRDLEDAVADRVR